MSSKNSSRGEVAASLARAARVPAVVLGRISLARSQVVDAVVATSSGRGGIRRDELARRIAAAVGPFAARGALASGGEGHAGRGRGAALWLAQDRCLVGLWPDPPPIAPFVALVSDRPDEVSAPWRRDIAKVGLVYETERLRAEPVGPHGLDTDAGMGGIERDALAQDIPRLIAIGLVLCDRSGQVVYANAAAEQWMASRGAISMQGGRLVARRPDVRRRLEEALEKATVRDPRGSGALALPRGGGDPVPDVLTVLPFAGAPCALMVFGGRDWDAGRSELALRAIGLTRAERRLVGHLCRGRALEDAAGEADVTISTARTYLKRIFAKTGTHRQSELVALLASLTPPVAVRGPLDIRVSSSGDLHEYAVSEWPTPPRASRRPPRGAPGRGGRGPPRRGPPPEGRPRGPIRWPR